MSNELDTLSGEIAPYSPGQPLSPMEHDSWANTGDVDLLREDHSHRSGGVQLFGAPLPAGTTAQQIEVMLGRLGAAYMADFSALGYPSTYINAAVQFMTANATKAPYHVRQLHNFNMHGQDDYLGHAFANMVQSSLSGSPRAKQQFVTACLQWLARTAKKLSSQQLEVSHETTRTSPNSAEAMLNGLSDADYNKVIKINEQALARTMQILQQRWGDYTFRQNIEIANNYLHSLPEADQRYFDQFTTVNGVNWIHLRNTPDFIIAMFDAATGAHNIPKDGAGIAREIKEIETCMRTNRAAYLKDPQLQARYRTLLDMKQG